MQLNLVRNARKSMLSANFLNLLFKAGKVKLHRLSAAAAGQVMVVFGLAYSVSGFAVGQQQAVGNPLLNQVRQRSIDGGESEFFASCNNPLVKLLR
jgi:hypothetical protein